eukprot:5359142-Heterocapsa_arctica.AAC.1
MRRQVEGGREQHSFPFEKINDKSLPSEKSLGRDSESRAKVSADVATFLANTLHNKELWSEFQNSDNEQQSC